MLACRIPRHEIPYAFETLFFKSLNMMIVLTRKALELLADDSEVNVTTLWNRRCNALNHRSFFNQTY